MSADVRVGCVIPVFCPGPDLLQGVESVIAQVHDLVLIVDEALPGPDTEAILADCVRAGARVVRHGANRGIGAALNTGARALRERSPAPDHVMTLDQDSSLADGYVHQLVEAGRAAADRGIRVGMVAPSHVGSIGRMLAKEVDGVVLGGEPIQSGLLVPGPVLDALRGFDETLFIDGVDTDFYLRALDAGYACVVAPGTRMGHRLGRSHDGPVRSGPALTVASDFRYYYQWRNLLLLGRRHACKHPRWAARALWKSVRHLGIVTVFVPGRRSRLARAWSGLRAGAAGRRGAAED